MKRLALLLAAVACGDNLSDPTQPQSGSRLKLGWYLYEGGARELERSWYYDAQLRERCSTRTLSDGKAYCLPATDEALYVGDTCTRALGRTRIGATPAPFFATQFDLRDEVLLSRVFRRGAVAAAPLVIWRKGYNGCSGPYGPGEDFEWFELGDEIVVDELARMHQRTVSSSELAVTHETSDDGLRAPIAFYDPARHVRCETVDRPNAESLECAPFDTPLISYFHDAACTQPKLATEVGYILGYAKQYSVATSCWRYFAIGDEVTAPPLYEQVGPSCLDVAAPGGQRFFMTAGPYMMPALQRVHDETGARVQSITRVNGDLRVADRWMFDRDLGTDCAHDAELRCVPVTDVIVESFFADTNCQTPLELAQVPVGECDPPTKLARQDTAYRPLVAPYTQTIWVPSTGDTCSMYSPPAPKVAYTVGPPLPSTAFATAELKIDP